MKNNGSADIAIIRDKDVKINEEAQESSGKF